MSKHKKSGDERPVQTLDDISIDRPRLTPQGRTDPNATGKDSTYPIGPGEKQGLPDKPEG